MEPLSWRLARLVYGAHDTDVLSKAQVDQPTKRYALRPMTYARRWTQSLLRALRRVVSLHPALMRVSHRLYRPYRSYQNLLCVLPLKQAPRVRPVGRGLNVIGDLCAETGLGQSARGTLRAAEAVGLPVAATDVVLDLNMSRKTEYVKPSLLGEPRYDITVLHANPNQLFRAVMKVGGHFWDRHNIGYWVWEVNKWPKDWKPAFEFFDEIWTPSTYSKQVIGLHANRPITVIPHNIDPELPEGLDRAAMKLPIGGFIFLTLGDILSNPERKNLLGTLEAYSRAFGTSTPGVYLVLKLNRTRFRPDYVKHVMKYVEANPTILLLEGYLDRPTLSGLMNVSDCFVSMHRSEGFGLPLAEAMFFGKPVIATGWSGNTDFMNEDNSLPVRYELVELERDIPPYEQGSIWAEPDVDHAAELMKRIVSDADLRMYIGLKAATEIRTNFSPEASGRLMLDRLAKITRS